ncbi:Cellulose synthase operon protein C precursor [Raoultella terrigena]|uniref:Cellulose synthase operon protein C n=1 Tax=Raoultella terrigena TaxID=577 RepID=A0A4U9D290_RAOTE|nr:Cellulose synthase operon protein C precursor [Raoultella terrigena]
MKIWCVNRCTGWKLIDPNNPDVISARMRYLLRQGDTDGAKKQLDRLSKLAPDSTA